MTGYGEPRGTKDVDFMVFCSYEDMGKMASLAKKEGLHHDTAWTERNPFLNGLVVRYRYRGMPVDFLVPRDPHEATLPRRLKRVRIANQTCHVLRPDDYLLLKAKAGRGRDFSDAIRVAVRYLADLDYKYLRSWSIRLHVFEEMQYILATAEQGGE